MLLSTVLSLIEDNLLEELLNILEKIYEQEERKLFQKHKFIKNFISKYMLCMPLELCRIVLRELKIAETVEELEWILTQIGLYDIPSQDNRKDIIVFKTIIHQRPYYSKIPSL
ncbi:UNVERIFIED_CONTAM: hypothetical protein RMT77_011807 [Armadillidium vulgare]